MHNFFESVVTSTIIERKLVTFENILDFLNDSSKSQNDSWKPAFVLA